MASKNATQTGLSKYKATGGARGITATKLAGNVARREKALAMNSNDIDLGQDDNFSGLSKDVSNCLVNMNTGTSTKMSLLKVMIVKCDENVSTHSRIKNCMEVGDLDEAYRLISVIEESNLATLSDLQYEISDGINII